MKINELKTPKPALNEGFLDALIGDYGAAGLQSMFKSGMTTKAQLAKNIFVKDFVADALASLTTGIQTGVVNPNSGSVAQPPADTPADEKKPVAKPAAATPPVPNAVKKANAVPDDIQESTYHKLNAIFENIVNINELFGKKQPVVNPNAMGVADFISAWLDKYMGPVEWHDKKAQVDPLIQAVASNPKNPKKALVTLANAMFSIASVSKVTPPGIANALPKNPEQPPAQTTAQPQPAQTKAQTPPAKPKRTGGKAAGKLSDDPRAVARRQATAARRAAAAGLQVSYPEKGAPATAKVRPKKPKT